MTSQISKTAATCLRRCLLALIAILLYVGRAQAQQDSTASQQQSSTQQPSMAQQLAALQRLEAMQPDSLSPKVQQAVLLLGFVCTHPQDGKARQYVDEAQRIIGKIEALKPQKAADRSDLATLHGFYYTALIVMSPQQNGPRYYRQALDNFDEALKLNPDNAMAKQLQEQFRQGMGRAN